MRDFLCARSRGLTKRGVIMKSTGQYAGGLCVARQKPCMPASVNAVLKLRAGLERNAPMSSSVIVSILDAAWGWMSQYELSNRRMAITLITGITWLLRSFSAIITAKMRDVRKRLCRLRMPVAVIINAAMIVFFLSGFFANFRMYMTASGVIEYAKSRFMWPARKRS